MDVKCSVVARAGLESSEVDTEDPSLAKEVGGVKISLRLSHKISRIDRNLIDLASSRLKEAHMA
jgi:hypothetical protein